MLAHAASLTDEADGDLRPARLVEGDREAWDDLVRWLRPQLVACARSLGVDPNAAEEHAEETLGTTFIAIAQFAGRSRLARWACGILRNSIREQRREVAVRRRHQPKVAVPIEAPEDRWAGEAAMLHEERMAPVVQAMERVRGRTAAAVYETFVLFAVEGLKYREIAEEQGIPDDTVKSRIHRVRAMLREELVRMGVGP